MACNQRYLLDLKSCLEEPTGAFVAQVVDAHPVNMTDLSKSGPTHCYFTPEQVTFAWNELTAWVNKGVRPRDGLNITKP